MTSDEVIEEMEPVLMVTIPLEQYNKLTALLSQFNEIIETHRKAIEGAYQQKITYLERRVDSMHERELRERVGK